MQIEAASVDDSRAIAEIHVAAWRAAYAGIVSAAHLATLSVEERQAAWAEKLGAGLPGVLVARIDGGVVGFLAYGPSRDATAATAVGEVRALYVSPAHWGAGAGKGLCMAGLASLRALDFNAVTLWVMALNTRAIAFYEGLGFEREPGSEKTFRLGEQELVEVRLVHANLRVSPSAMQASIRRPDRSIDETR